MNHSPQDLAPDVAADALRLAVRLHDAVPAIDSRPVESPPTASPAAPQEPGVAYRDLVAAAGETGTSEQALWMASAAVRLNTGAPAAIGEVLAFEHAVGGTPLSAASMSSRLAALGLEVADEATVGDHQLLALHFLGSRSLIAHTPTERAAQRLGWPVVLVDLYTQATCDPPRQTVSIRVPLGADAADRGRKIATRGALKGIPFAAILGGGGLLLHPAAAALSFACGIGVVVAREFLAQPTRGRARAEMQARILAFLRHVP